MEEFIKILLIFGLFSIIFLIIGIRYMKYSNNFYRKSHIKDGFIIDNIKSDLEAGVSPKVEYYDDDGNIKTHIINKISPFGYKIGKKVKLRLLEESKRVICKFNSKMDIFFNSILFFSLAFVCLISIVLYFFITN